MKTSILGVKLTVWEPARRRSEELHIIQLSLESGRLREYVCDPLFGLCHEGLYINVCIQYNTILLSKCSCSTRVLLSNYSPPHVRKLTSRATWTRDRSWLDKIITRLPIQTASLNIKDSNKQVNWLNWSSEVFSANYKITKAKSKSQNHLLEITKSLYRKITILQRTFPDVA